MLLDLAIRNEVPNHPDLVLFALLYFVLELSKFEEDDLTNCYIHTKASRCECIITVIYVQGLQNEVDIIFVVLEILGNSSLEYILSKKSATCSSRSHFRR